MSKGFLNGLFMGAITGTLIGVFLNPQLKPQHRKKINHISHELKKQTQGIINGIRENRE
ncbi:YtxH domain-containing protein [Thermoanaerobacteraceae bacterium SP2]|jgi:gas vesicle protein|nr:YtxH domain-containing protein [Thermoanaerobacteraceae bacterium SP2]